MDKPFLVTRNLARLLTILFAAFISIFALDVFSEDLNFWNTFIALFMHLIPTFMVLILLYLSWHREWIGSITFPSLGIAYLVISWGKMLWTVHLAITLPLFVIGALFLASWWYKKHIN